MERKKRVVPREVSSADGNRVRNPSVTETTDGRTTNKELSTNQDTTDGDA